MNKGSISIIKSDIKKLLNSGETAYSLAKKTGINVSSIQRYMNGERKIGNMTLDTAEKFYKLIESKKND